MFKFKYSGYSWLGLIPQHWVKCKIKDLFYRKNKKAMQSDPVVLCLARDDIKIRDISTNEGQIAASYFEYNLVEPDDVLLNPMDLQSGANCCISKVSGVISPAYINLHSKGFADPRFYDYYFKIQYWTFAFFSYGKGVSFDNRWTLNTNTLMNYIAFKIPKDEQQIIADFLDDKCAQIDEIICDLEKKNNNLEEYKKSIIFESVTKGLEKNVEYKDSGVYRIGKIPSSWKILDGKYCFENKKEIVGVYVDNFERLALTLNGVIKRSKDDDEGLQPKDFSTYQILRENELVFKLIDLQNFQTSRVGLSKYVGIVSPAYIILKSKHNVLSCYAEKFYLMMWYNHIFNHLGDDGVRSSLNSSELLNLPFLLPPLSEQQKIADFLDDKCAQIDEIISGTKKQIETLKLYKQSLIYEYVTGKKEVPNYE